MTRLLPFLALLIAVAAAGQGVLVSYPDIPANPELEAGLLRATNEARAAHGLPPLQLDASLALAARHHAAEMAELGYLAHESPRDGSRDLGQRLNRAGAMLESAAENLAYLQHVPDLPGATVQGWLESPGHRANLLGQFNLVGFGTAQGHSGGHYVVQVLGLQTLGINQASVHEQTVPLLKLELTLELNQPKEVGVWLGGTFDGAQELPAGRSSLTVPIEATEPVHVNIGVRQTSAVDNEPFIAAGSGWFDPLENSWSPSSAAAAGDARFVSARANWHDEQRWTVELELQEAPLRRLGLWLNEEWHDELHVSGSQLSFHVPASSAPGTAVMLGYEDPPGSGSYVLFAHYTLVDGPGDAAALLASNPDQ